MFDKIKELTARVEEARGALAAADLALKEALAARDGLVGRFVTLPRSRGRFRIETVIYRPDGSVFKVAGRKIKKDGSTSRMLGYAYANWKNGEVEGLEPL